MRRVLLLGSLTSLAAAAPGCKPPTCPPAEVTPPAAETVAGWVDPARPRVAVELDGRPRVAVLDTAYPRSAIELGRAVPDQNDAILTLGGASAGPLHWDLWVAPEGADLVAGADVLSQLPLVLDARARATRFLPAFLPGDGVAPLTLWSSGLCRGDDAQGGPEGPDLLLVNAELEGRPVTLAVDTGADITIVRTDTVADLGSRPLLSGIVVESHFIGRNLLTATRARSLSIGGAISVAAPVLVTSLGGLERQGGLSEWYRDAPAQIDGLLGMSFLREFEVSLALRDGAGGRALGLTRFDTQDHWSRHFVGVGVATRPSEPPEPAGLRVESVFSPSPARDAGLSAGDVILTVNGVPAASLPTPWGVPGTVVELRSQRNGTILTAQVEIKDLLPDPAP